MSRIRFAATFAVFAALLVIGAVPKLIGSSVGDTCHRAVGGRARTASSAGSRAAAAGAGVAQL
jgi:hypothetical protein